MQCRPGAVALVCAQGMAGNAGAEHFRAGIAGVGRALPAQAVPNDAIAMRLGVDAEWIERRTGIRARRHVRMPYPHTHHTTPATVPTNVNVAATAAHSAHV